MVDFSISPKDFLISSPGSMTTAATISFLSFSTAISFCITISLSFFFLAPFPVDKP